MTPRRRPILLAVLISALGTTGCDDDDKAVEVNETLNGLVTTEDDHGGTMRTTYRNGVRHGEFVWLRDDGGVYQEGEYVDGEKEGVWLYDDIVVRFETYYEMGVKCGEEQRWSNLGEIVVVRETRFYLDDDLSARGEWQCTEQGECQKWTGIWYERGGDGAVVRRTYEEGVSTGEEPVGEPTSCHSNLFEAP